MSAVELRRTQREEDYDNLSSEEGGSGSASESSNDSQNVPITRLTTSNVLKQISEDANTYGLLELQQSGLMAILALWHTIGLWLTACMLLCMVLQKILKGYVQWMELVMYNDEDGAIVRIDDLLRYTTVVLRSWFTVVCYSDLARYCFWLARDAWRPDAFEAYRRALLGLGQVEMASGNLCTDCRGLPCGWPHQGVGRLRRYADLVLQFLIYFSFDIFPLWGLVRHVSSASVSITTVCATLTIRAGIVGFIHAALYKVVWTATDISMKIDGLRKAIAIGEADDDDEEAEQQDLVHERSRSGSALAQPVIEELRSRFQVASKMNICVPTCRVLSLVTPHLMWMGLMALGIYLQRVSIFVFGLAFLSFQVGIKAQVTCMKMGAMSKLRMRASRGRESLFKALQIWGEECCGLEADIQLKRRFVFVVMISTQLILFVFLEWAAYSRVCLIFIFLQLWQLTVPCQGSLGWLFGLLEAGIILVGSSAASLLYLPTYKQAGETILFVVAHQAGLPRKTYVGIQGSKVVQFVIGMTFCAITLALVTTTMTVAHTEHQSSAADSKMCTNCTYYTVPYIFKRVATGLACPYWFELGGRDRRFSLSDFGLFSLIAYEPEETIHTTLEHFFPGWKLVYSKRFNIKDQSKDWTTFFEFVSPDAASTVFAVRGTASPLDALNDMVIWMPAALIELFSFLGPDMLAPVAEGIKFLSAVMGRLDTANFKMLENHVMDRMRADKEYKSEYYITGHSLGGGLAKIVALNALTEGLDLPAITFMSPGLASTQYLVCSNIQSKVERLVNKRFKEVKKPQLDPYQSFVSGNNRVGLTAEFLHDHTRTITVMPANDIVSRIDTQTGQVIPIGCPFGNPLDCHLIGTGLCEIFSQCGSGRRREDLQVPCGFCDKMPCKPGVPTAKFHVSPDPTVHVEFEPGNGEK